MEFESIKLHLLGMWMFVKNKLMAFFTVITV